MDNEYDEFGNYIGPEIRDSDDEEEYEDAFGAERGEEEEGR
jgi:hypothetical protein